MKRSRKIYMIGLALLTALFLGSLTASAEVSTVKVKGRYGQTEARSMLAMINEFRTGSDAWYWNETNTEKIYERGLQPLVYDYQLEEVAMLRAMEIAVYYDHARPNGTGYVWPLLKPSTGTYEAAENIAAGYMTAADVFEGWQETNENYDDQGHRRNMLSSDVTAVGIGHVYYNGYHYWVQEFRAPAGSTPETPANDSETIADVEVESSLITNKSVKPLVNSIELPYGSSVGLPKVTGGIRTIKSWPGYNLCPIELSCEWTSADMGENYIQLDKSQGTITAVGVGKTEITVAALGTTCTIPVTVVEAPIDSAENPARITLEPSELGYTGAELTPEVTVTCGGKTLIPGTDYEITFENNVNAGKAAVTISAKGNYTGTLTKEFEITPKEMGEESSLTIEPEEVVYTGAGLTPKVTVTCEGKTLNPDTDYDIEFKDNKNVGKAAVTVSAKGNYKGELTGTFMILPLNLENCTVDVPDQEYTGSEIIPAVMVKNGDIELDKSNYTVDYGMDNTEVGTVSVKITGQSNCTGELSETFHIVPFDLKNCTADAIPAQKYTGSEIRPSVTVRHGERILAEGTDYLIEYSENKDPGTAAVTLTGQGNYTGTMKQNFVIREQPKETEKNPGGGEDQTAGGQGKPSKTVLKKGARQKDPATGTVYKVTNSNKTGTPTVEYTTPGNKKKAVVNIPATVTIGNVKCKVASIANNAFKNNKKLKKVVIGKNVSVIGSNAFRGCTKLSSVTLGAGVVTIKAGAFCNCTALKQLTIPAKVTTIGKQALYGCKKLTRIVIKTQKLTAKSIGKNAFGKLYAKVTVKVPKNKQKEYKKILKGKGLGAKSKIS